MKKFLHFKHRLLLALLTAFLAVPQAWADDITDAASLQTAIDAAAAGGTVTLTQDITGVSQVITIGKSLTLDLNGYTLSGTGGLHNEAQPYTMFYVIKDLTLTGTGNITVSDSQEGSVYGAYVQNGQLTVGDGVTLSVTNTNTSASSRAIGVYVRAERTLTQTGGTISSTSESGTAYGILSYGTVNLTGGEVKSSGNINYAVAGYNGTVTVDGATITASGTSSYGVAALASTTSAGTLQLNGGAVTATGDTRSYAVSIAKGNNDYTPTCTITGGKYKGGTGALNYTSGIDQNVLAVSGGYFSNSVAVTFIPDGYGRYELTSGDEYEAGYHYEVAQNVAKIGTTNYKSLAEAISAATDGQTVTLLTDITSLTTISGKSNITLNLNDNTIDRTSHGTTGINIVSSTVTVKNGTIKMAATSTTGSNVYPTQGIRIQSSTVTLDGLDVEAASACLLYEQNNTVIVNSGTYKGIGEEGHGLSMSAWYHCNNNTLTVNGGTITGTGAGIYAGYGYGYDTDDEIEAANYKPNASGNSSNAISITGGLVEGGTYALGVSYNTGTKINISGGTINFDSEKGGLLENKGAEEVAVAVSGGTFSAAIDEDFCKGYALVKNDNDNTYSVETATRDNSISYKESADGEDQFLTGKTITIDDTGSNFYSFNVPYDMTGKTITYTRTFSNTNYKAWFVPFEVSAVNDSVEFYELANINSTVDENQVNSGNWYIVLNPVTTGTVKANTPYVVKPKYAGKVTFTNENNAIYKLGENEGSLSQTTLDGKVKLTLKGNYETKTVSEDDFGWYAFSGGKFSKQTIKSVGHTLPPMRFYLTITDADGNNISTKNYQINMFVDDDPTGISGVETNVEPEAEVIYDLQGRRVANPSKGIYIINGKKVIIR